MKIRANKKQIADIVRYIIQPKNAHACYLSTGVAQVTLKKIIAGDFVAEKKIEAVTNFTSKVKSNENIG